MKKVLNKIIASAMSLAIMGLMFTETTPKININNYENIFLTASAEETKTFIGDSYGLQLEYKVLSDETIEITKFISTTSSVIELPSTIDGKKVTSIGRNAFSYCTDLTSITIPDNVTSIGSYAFGECTSLKYIKLGNGVTKIGAWAFWGCSNLLSITIPDGVTSIGVCAFKSCSNLSSISIPNSVTSICRSAFYGCSSLTSITIPDGVTSIGEYAFSYCKSFTSIMIPENVTSIGNGVFNNCTSLEKINVSENNKYYISIDGVLFSEDHTQLIAYPIGRTNAEYTIPYGVTKIAPYAFEYHSSLSSITIPDGVTNIGEHAFYGCKSLTNITIPDSVMSIGSYAFYNTPFLKNQKTDVKYAGKLAIYCNKAVNSLEIKEGTKGIADGAFYFCSELTSIIIPDSVTNIGNEAFRSCPNLTSITIPEGVKSLGKYAFSYCKSLTSMTIPDSVTSIGEDAFSDCTSLTSITIPDSVTSIGEYAFSDCTSLTSIMIPNSVTNIGWRAFEECTSLSSITIKNPNCIIYDSWDTISKNTVIYGYKNSTAQEYADKNNRKFIAIDENPAITTPAVTTAITTTLVSPEPINHIGDINSDGKINIFDLTALKRAINSGATSKLSFINSDINSDGKIDYYDCAALQYFLVNKTLPERSITQYYENFSSESIIDESDAKEIILENQESMGLSQKGLELVFNNSETIENCDFYHYDLTYNGIPVYGKEITVSADQNDNPYLMIGNCEEIADISTVPSITAEQAVNIANNETDQQNFTDAKLVLYPVDDKFVLVYICNGLDSLNVIDARNGSVIKNESTVLTATANAWGQRGDLHQVTFDEETGELYDKSRNLKIINDYTSQDENKPGPFIPTYVNINKLNLSNDPNSNKYEYSAADAMANVTKSIDYFEKFGVEFNNGVYVSVNDSDPKLKNNAGGAWDSDTDYAFIWFGLRSNSKPQFSAYLDVAGHEYTHGVTGKKAFGNVGYDAKYLERGALMEAYSDIFGELIELDSTGNTDWIHDKNGSNNPRNIKNPQHNNCPDKYNGNGFYKVFNADKLSKNEAEHKADIYAHNNSTVISHAAYLMHNGYNGISLSADELAKVWYMSLQYLSSTSTMQDCSNAVIKSAELLLSDEKVEIVKQAFREVGLSDSIPITCNVISKNAQIKVIDKNSQTYTGDYKVNIYNVYNPANSGPFDINDHRTFNTKKLVEERIVKSSDLTDDCFNYDFANDGYYLINVSPADDTTTGSGSRLVCVKSGASSGRTNVLTDFTTTTQTEPVINNSVKIKEISFYNDSSAAITEDGSLYMWGSNYIERSEDGIICRINSTPIKVMDNVKSVSLGYGCSAAITNDGSLYMWGYNKYGQLGNSTTEDSLTPIKIMDNVKSVSLIDYHSTAITEDGCLYMWGYNRYGQLGNGESGYDENGKVRRSTTPIKIMDNVKSVTLESDHSGAITNDGTLYMWGNNDCGQLGSGTNKDSSTPIKIMNNVKSISLYNNSSAATTEDGSLYMWGSNYIGRIENGIKSSINSTPIKVMDNVKSVSLGYGCSAAITNDDSLYMWGYNKYGQLGNSTTEDSLTPIKIMDNVKSVSLIDCHSTAITNDSGLYMWGYNKYGQLGNGTKVNSSTPIKIMDNVKSVTLESGCSGSTTNDGSLYMWGSNGSCQFGNGTKESSSVPIKIEIPSASTRTITNFTYLANEPILQTE